MAEAIGKTERQLNLISALLKSRQGMTWPDIHHIHGYDDDAAERARKRRLERDLHEIAAIGLHVERIPEGQSRVRYAIHRPSALLPSLQLSPEQRVLLFRIGMAFMEEQNSLTRHLSTALMKLQSGAGASSQPVDPPPAIVRRSLSRSAAEAAPLAALVDAWIERRVVSFDYRARDGRTARRTVAPYALVSRRGGWYLIGMDRERGSERTFRLARIQGRVVPAADGGHGYEIPAGFDAERSFSSNAFGGAGPGDSAFRDVRIRFSADVAFAVLNEFEGIYSFEHEPDGVVMHIPHAWPGELLRYLGEFPGHWEVLNPPALREVVAKQLRGALQSVKGVSK